ncbi:MAG: futalosine hydrolase [Chitinophagaceae bacterium]
MPCLLVSATVLEIAPFLEKYRENNQLPPVDILITGIGLTAATYSLTRQLAVKRPAIIIQAGIAGCFDKRIKLGSVFAVKQEAIADLGVMEAGRSKTIFDLGLVPNNQYPFSNGWLVNKSDTLKKTTLRKVKAVSVNQITTESQKIRSYKATFDPLLESMEGAALHYTCLMEKIPFVQLRAVSNYTGERNKKNWDIKTAIGNLNNELIRLLEKI